MIISRRIVLHFPRRLVDRPIIYRLIKDHDLEFNILKASVTPEEEGLMVLELKGLREQYDRGIQYLSDSGVTVQPLSQSVTRDEERCTQCGVCITACPTEAFEVDLTTRRVAFHDDRCLACGLCIRTCPPRAMQLHF